MSIEAKIKELEARRAAMRDAVAKQEEEVKLYRQEAARTLVRRPL